MPTLWSDTVWIFVDYNNNGVMERLPLLSGATLTATSPGGKVVEEAGNNQGVWVMGNARSADVFTATVQLFTTVKDVAGTCAYASNYPPVVEYTSATKISFTGTPPYELLLAKAGSPGETEQVESGNKFLLPCDYTLTSFTDATGAPGTMDEYCTTPGRMVDFTAFNPCEGAATGTVWYLTDTRESNNIQTYKVKKMQDGRIWMVQDLKFGDRCKNNSYNSISSDKTGGVSSIDTYYGNCTASANSATPSARGYLYDWAAAVNKAGAYNNSTSYRGCSGKSAGTTSTNPGACQGICPAGWHIPTGNTTGEFYDLHSKCSAGNWTCWNASSDWEGVLGGYCDYNGTPNNQGSGAYYWSSTYINSSDSEGLQFSSGNTNPGTADFGKYYGRTVRCVRNY
jgi:uncharacterized protein (TIGR02145 family)